MNHASVELDAKMRNRLSIAIAVFLVSAQIAVGQIISSDRLVAWQGNVGIPGGIPTYNTTSAVISAGASLATVNSAISACPSGQVVALSAGTYNFGTDMSLNDKVGVVVRGAGPNSTTITFSSGGVTMKSSDRGDSHLIGVNLSQNAVKGASTIFVASVPSWVTVGDLIGIDQLDDPIFSTSGTGDSYRGAVGYGTRGVSQLDRVVSKTSTSVTFEVPMYWGWQTSLGAQIFQPHYDPSSGKAVTLCGIEGVTIKQTYAGGGVCCSSILLDSADNCWVKNCVVTNESGGSAVQGYFSYRCEVRHCTFVNSQVLDGGDGYGVAPYNNCSGWLTEDNIFVLLHASMDAESASGNVFAYNYETKGQSAAGFNQNAAGSAHDTTSFMNLWEGNFTDDKMLADYTHGANAYGTVFRCRITGTNTVAARVDDSQTPVSIQYYNRFWNIVGNVLGVTGVQNKYMTDNTSTSTGSQGSIFKIGGDDLPLIDVNSYTSGAFVLIHGNWDSVQNTVTWNPLVSSQTLPNSCYLGGKPSYWGSTQPWPPFDPANPSGASRTNIPAGYRYVFGVDPPTTVMAPPPPLINLHAE